MRQNIKLFRVVSYVLGLNSDSLTVKDIKEQIERNRHPEFHYVREIDVTNIGEWSDDHPCNKIGCDYSKYFPEINPQTRDQELLEVLKKSRIEMYAQMDLLDTANREIEKLKEEIEKLKKVQEFVKTIKDLTK